LYREILKYQENNPIPNTNLNLLSIYKVSFSFEKDTLLTISLSPTGITDKNNSYGIYKDKILQRTYVMDSQKVSKNFIKMYKKDSVEYYILKGTPPHTDNMYPVYMYKVRGDKLILLDSIK